MTQIELLKERLKTGNVKFKFTKKNGEERIAFGTRNMTTISEKNATPNGNGSEKNGVMAYYDIDKEGWRSFNEESFIEIIEQ